MLNKDQYNQDEYNNYYRQEAEGAKIKNSGSQDSKKSKFILFLSLIALAVAGFFGFKMLSSSQTNDKSTKEVTHITTQENNDVENKSKEIVKTSNVETTESENIAQGSDIETQIANAIKNNTQASESMSAQDIAKVVALVMQQMNQQKSTQATTKNENTPVVNEDDKELMNTLLNTNVDSVQENTKIDYSDSNTSTNTEIQSDTKKVDTYNKVTVQSTSGEDELSKLSEQINSVMDNEITTGSNADNSTYTKSIKKEVATRSNEMRIIVVKKGDTLGKIAQRAYGNVMDYKKIYQANPDILNRPDRIYIGQKLRIPK